MVMDIREGADKSGLVRAAKDRLRDVKKELEMLDERRRTLEQEMSRLSAESGYLEGLLEIHGANTPGGRTNVEPDRTRGGSDVADVVVSVIRDAGTPLHFRDIEGRVRTRGIQAGGKDPANVLLAKYFDDPRLYRPARGTYGLREWNRSARSVGTRRVRTGGN